MPEEPATPTLFDRLLEEQAKWLETIVGYADALATDQDFLTNLSNAFRGSLMAGRAMPSVLDATVNRAGGAPATRQEEILQELHMLRGAVADVALEIAEFRAEVRSKRGPEKAAEKAAPAKPAKPEKAAAAEKGNKHASGKKGQ